MEAATVAVATAMSKLQVSKTPLTRSDFDGGPISLDEIEPGLFLGNLTAATHMGTLRAFKITHILTLDSVPLPKHITEASFLTTKYVQIADMPKEDILHHLEQCVDFISAALSSDSGNILVHCYFGVSRSSSAVIAYVMKRHNLDYRPAYELVKSKRRFVQPNPGFVTQLKLFRRMGCTIDAQYQRYKLYRLRMAGEQVRKAKRLPQCFNSLIKADPAVLQENPEPIVYRCRKCRRILACRSHVLPHQSKAEQQQQQQQQQPAAVVDDTASPAARLLEEIAAQIRNLPVVAACKSIIFVEPIAWMQNILHDTQGRLSCPKCEQKLGSFSWINGCQCPCGEEVSPAFYLTPSRVELSHYVQNVQTTV